MVSESIINKLQLVFEGAPWYGNSVVTVLENIRDPNQSLNDGNSIGQLLEHIITWRNFVIEKINGSEAFDIGLNSKIDWNRNKVYNEDEMEELKQRLNQTQLEIKKILKDKSDLWFDETVPGKEYSFEFLLEGIIQHDIYHLGQIALLKK